MLDKKKMLETAIARMADLKVGIRSMTQAVETCRAASASAWRWPARRPLPNTW
jgi:hypothetical protein